MNGKIEVYTGPMFSSKSLMMFLAYEMSAIAGESILAFKPRLDDRFGSDVIKSRKFAQTIEAVSISDVSELLNYESEVYIVDEFQFLTGDVSVIRDMANQGKSFYIAGLDMTAEGKPFGIMPDILAIADVVHKRVACCHDCRKKEAIFSFYLGTKDKDILVGNGEYIPLCRSCWRARMANKKQDFLL